MSDEEGIVRLKTRLLNQEYSKEHINPVVFLSNHVVVERCLQRHHTDLKHAGVQDLSVILREKVWILKGTKTICRVIHQCLPCKRHSVRHFQAVEALLLT